MTMQRSSGRRGPDIVPDFDLWDEIRKTAVPIHQHKARPAAPEKPHRALKTPAMPAGTVMRNPHNAQQKTPAAPPQPRHQLTGLDRRTAQKLTRGKMAVEATVDLHGLGAEVARHRLLRFLATARSHGHRTVLVITGKGASPFAGTTLHGRTHFDAPERLGRLRRLLPQWIAEAEFREHVTGFQPAHPRHGGGGAFYVRLRRPVRHEP
jgi:DNA-nicking Smr family endonuclease